MKIAISADGNNLDAKVSYRFSTAGYLLLFDTDTGEYEAVPNPFSTGQEGAGVQAIVLAASKGAKAVLTGYISPGIAGQLKASGIEVITGVSGTVRDAVAQYKKLSSAGASGAITSAALAIISRDIFMQALRSSARQFLALLPVMIGVVLLTGLFEAFISRELLSSLFSGNAVLDTLWGACFGSIFAGNPINSYIIGGELLKYGVSLFAVTAFILTWVTVGVVQLPAEIAAFGRRFALMRNGVSFILAMPLAIVTVLIVNILAGWAS